MKKEEKDYILRGSGSGALVLKLFIALLVDFNGERTGKFLSTQLCCFDKLLLPAVYNR